MLKGIVNMRLKQTTDNLRDEIKKENKMVQAIKEDIGYDLIYEMMLPERRPINDFFMSIG